MGRSDVPVVLVTSGGAGVGAFEEAVQVVLECGPVQVLAVAGRNGAEALRKRLAALPVPAGSSLHPFGFVSTIEELMAAADLAVAKSGGLTTSECLALGLPMVVRDPIPGQEERNADFILEAGAGVKAHGLASLRFKVAELLATPHGSSACALRPALPAGRMPPRRSCARCSRQGEDPAYPGRARITARGCPDWASCAAPVARSPPSLP